MQVHEIDTLRLAAPEGKRLVVLGDPVAHSLSPAMHNAALAEMARKWPGFADWRYEAVHVRADDLERALPVLHAAGVAGINLTIPHKVRVLDILDEVDETARRMGAVNTLIWNPTGYHGANTDGYGILKAMEACFGRSPEGADVWVFGAGGAARGIIAACLDSGARRLTVLNRSPGRLRELESAMRGQRQPGLDRVRFLVPGEAAADIETAAILINATSLGLKSGDPSPVGGAFLRPGVVVYDTTYGTENQLALACRQAGIAYADGLSMLVWQGVLSLEIWTGKSVPARVMREAAEAELKRRKTHG